MPVVQELTDERQPRYRLCKQTPKGDAMNRAPRNKLIAPAMTRAEWEELPEGVRHFLPWDRCKRPETIKPVAPPDKAKREGYRYFVDGRR
jgi:hypothetical protein